MGRWRRTEETSHHFGRLRRCEQASRASRARPLLRDQQSRRLSVQPDIPGLDDLPGLTSSQDSVGSEMDIPDLLVTAAPANVRKRSYGGEEEEEDETQGALPVPFGNNWREKNDWIDAEVSPRSLAPMGWENTRVMAVPKGRGRKSEDTGEGRGSRFGVVRGSGCADDFEEAEFLEMDVEY